MRTLRGLGAGLADIRRTLDGGSTLRDLLVEHLSRVDGQERDVRARRAVLRALVAEDDPEAQSGLFRALVGMSDAERESLVDDFWRDVSAGLPSHLAERLQPRPPRLHNEATAEQLQAWIELATLTRDDAFRRDVRAYFDDTYLTGPGPGMSTPEVQDFLHGAGSGLGEQLAAAHRSGLPATSEYARELAVRLVRETAAALGVPATGDLAERFAARYATLAQLRSDALSDPGYVATYGRYLALAQAVDPQFGAEDGDDATDPAELGEWLAAALRAASAEV